MKKRISILAIAALCVVALTVAATAAFGGPRGANTRGKTHHTAARAAKPGTIYTAVVNSDATLARGTAVSSGVGGGTGTYEVLFPKKIRKCTYVATLGLSGHSGTESPGSIEVVGRVSSAKGVFVSTEDPSGTRADRGFHLAVIC